MQNNGQRIMLVIGILAGIGAIGCFCTVMFYLYSTIHSMGSYQDVKEEVQAERTEVKYTIEEIEGSEFTGILDVEETKIPQYVITDIENHPIDFDKLQEINSELYAWIRIPDTNIDYPVAQHEGEDQKFYLHHDLYKDPQFAGCIYSENVNMKDFLDPVTILYGHNMRNGSMFQNLHNFSNEKFFDEHKYFYVYMPDKTLVYEVYAAYPYDNRKIMASFNFAKTEDILNYIDTTIHPRSMDAKVREGIEAELNEKSHILTLSTCIGGEPSSRFLVQGLLVYEQQ